MTPPDSGEREVCELCGLRLARDGGDLINTCAWRKSGGDTLRECWQRTAGRLRTGTWLEPPLAQRILAALEGRGDMAERYALRDELRARVDGKA